MSGGHSLDHNVFALDSTPYKFLGNDDLFRSGFDSIFHMGGSRMVERRTHRIVRYTYRHPACSSHVGSVLAGRIILHPSLRLRPPSSGYNLRNEGRRKPYGADSAYAFHNRPGRRDILERLYPEKSFIKMDPYHRIYHHDTRIQSGPYIQIQLHADYGSSSRGLHMGPCIPFLPRETRRPDHLSCPLGLRCVHLVSDHVINL